MILFLQWELPIPLQSMAMLLPRGFVQDFACILLAKSRELIAMKVSKFCDSSSDVSFKYTNSDSIFNIIFMAKENQTPWLESASELYRPSDRRLLAKLVPISPDRGCHVVSVFLDLHRYFFFQVAPQLYSQG
jgi:hypothetical protein